MHRLLSLEPWREEAHRQLMLLLAQDGQRSAALAQFEICRQILDEELGVEPGQETKRLYERIHDEDLSELLLETQTEKEIFSGNIVVRPSKVCGKLYPQVSKAYSTAVHSILTGQIDAATALAKLEAELVEITGFKVGPPS